MIYLLAILLLTIFIFSIFMNKKDITAPAVVFSFGFAFQCMWAVLYHKAWRLDLHLNTFLVLFLGVLEFVFISGVIKYLFKLRDKKKGINVDEKSKLKVIKTNKVLEVLYLLFAIGMGAVYLYYVVRVVNGSFKSIGTISEAISSFDTLRKFSNDSEVANLPFVISNLNLAIIASGYWFMYVIINNFLAEKKISIIQILIVLVTMISSMLSGSRTPAFLMIISGLCYFLVLLNIKKNYKNIFSVKMFICLASLGVAALVLFQPVAKLLGRDIKNGAMAYLSIYCGAEVKNLDTYLQEKDYRERNNMFGSQTLYSIMLTVGDKMHYKKAKDYRLDLPFRQVDDMELGNVYTTFYAFVYDFGYIGLAIFVFIMSAICAVIYEYIVRLKNLEKIRISILVYGVLFGCLLLSFFSNRFYEDVFSMGFIKKLIVWIACTLVFCKLDFNKLFNRLGIRKESR